MTQSCFLSIMRVILQESRKIEVNAMLLQFKTKNYKSFLNEICFSMTPAPKQKGLDYSVLSTQVGTKKYKGLCCAVIYGPNASGKTNLIGAIDTLKSIVLRGNIRNSSVFSSNFAASSLELIPNCKDQHIPTEFAICFVDESLMFDYSITLDLGAFLDYNYSRSILEEKLSVNEKLIFRRSDTLEIDIPAIIKPYTNNSSGKMTSQMQEIAEGSLSKTELFLTNGFKTIYSQELVRRILDWFDKKLVVIYQSNDMRVTRRLSEPKANTVYVETTLTEAARMFGITASALGYKMAGEKEGEDLELYSILNHKNKMLPAELFESYGTIRFINEFPLVISAVLNGGTLIMDEFDASIHPMALMNIINIFHNDEINKKNAQLIFNTHNPIFLDASLLRRDEIKFIERDEVTGNSEHYSLSDFKTSEGVRKGEDYMNNYFISRYGAIRDVDFSPILEKLIADKEVTENE